MLRLAAIIAGGVVSAASVMAAGCLMFPGTALPRAVRFANGAALLSACVFGVLAGGFGHPAVYLLLSGLLGVAAWRSGAAVVHPLPRMHWFPRAALAAYGFLYLVYALAPEIQPDAFGYHLRLVSEYVRLQAFPNRIAFYDMLPQGMEMLFVPAFAVGGAPAAKLLHLLFLGATVPLLREIAREVGLTDRAGSVGACLLFLAPVCGVAGTAAYTDAGLLCAVCAVVYLLLRWEREGLPPLLVCAGMNAGFCYTVKPTFGWVAVAGTALVAVRAWRLRPVLTFGVTAAAVMAPWLIRGYWLTGNPVAPFLNAWFPNEVSTPALESALAANYSALRAGFSWRTALFDYTVGGGNQGLLGAGFLLLPLALLALRSKGGRLLAGWAVVLALPVLLNTGTRFLLPAMAPASIALAAVLPGRAGLAVVALQALASAPPVMELYDRKHEWRLGAWPVGAALGRISEDDYLHRTVPGFGVTDLLKEGTQPGARILALASVPEAYVPRELLVYWQSLEALRLTDALEFARMSQGTRARLLSWRWKGGEYRALRMTALSEVRVVEAHLQNGDAVAASWASLGPGGSVRLAASGAVTGADLLIWPGDQAKESTEGLGASGVWEPMGERAERGTHLIDLRRDATAYVRRSGHAYILVPVANDAFAPLGTDMMRHPAEWGVEARGNAGNLWLFRILPGLL
jgi:hypothetical protein